MYRVLCDKTTLHDDNLQDLKIINGKLTLELGKTGLFEFTIYPNHPYYDLIRPLKSYIEIYRNDEAIFKGRPLTIKYGFYNEKQVSCEGELAFLLDSLIEPHVYKGSFIGYLPYLLAKHNAQMEGTKQFKAGNVTVADFTEYTAVENLNYYSTLETLSKRMVEPSGGILSVRYVGDERYLDLLDMDIDAGNISNQPIRLGKNLLDIKRDTEGSELFTAIVPLGAKQEGSEIRIDIKKVNSGLPYIINEQAADFYGLIFRQVIFDNITYSQTLKEEATAYLDSMAAAVDSVEITAADLSSIDDTLDAYNVGQKVQVISPHHLTEPQVFLIKKMTISLSDHADTKIEIGRTKQGLTDNISGISDSVNSIETPTVQPYVIESGTTGIFNWKKFSDGTGEFFGKVPITGTDVSAALGNWFRSDALYSADAHPYPFQMTEAPAVNITFQTRNGLGAIAWAYSQDAETAQKYLPQCYLIRPTTATGILGNINIIGKGKL